MSSNNESSGEAKSRSFKEVVSEMVVAEQWKRCGAVLTTRTAYGAAAGLVLAVLLRRRGAGFAFGSGFGFGLGVGTGVGTALLDCHNRFENPYNQKL